MAGTGGKGKKTKKLKSVEKEPEPRLNGIRMPAVSERASRIFIRRARTATEARYANYFSVCTI